MQQFAVPGGSSASVRSPSAFSKAPWAGAGTFVLTAIDEKTRLDLTLASARHTPALRNSDHIAERAAQHPDKPAAVQLAALLVARPGTDPWRDAAVRQHARSLLAAIGQRPPDLRGRFMSV